MNDVARAVSALNAQGYTHVLRMPDGSLCGIGPQLFTTALYCGLSSTGYTRRYCYERRQDAIDALRAWDGQGDPGGPWIKVKGLGVDRLGPGAVREDIA